MADSEKILGRQHSDAMDEIQDHDIPMETTPMMAPNMEEVNPPGPHTNIIINRPIYDMKTFKTLAKQEPEPDETFGQMLRKKFSSCECSPKCIGKKFLSFVPLVQKLKDYNWKRDIVGDIVAGITVGVMHLPMGLAFAILANLPVVYGLYASFWPTLLYAFLGTGHHVSMGTMAVMSLLLGTVVERASINAAKDGAIVYTPESNVTDFIEVGSPLVANSTVEMDMPIVKDVRVTAAIGATFVMGIIQIILSILQLGKIASFMSMSFISGFTTGAACHIVTSQMKALLGISLPKHLGMFRLPMTWFEIFKQLPHTHIASLVLSLVCITLLLLLKFAINDNQKLKPYLKIPVPAELVVVILAALISHYAKLSPKFGIKVIGMIPRGFPAPALPDLSGASDYVVDSFVMAIVCFVISFAMASLFARKHNYDIDTNQEMFSYGICHGVGAFFFSFAGAAAPPRCMVLDGTGAKSQVAALFSSLVLMLIILAIGPLFQPLPHPSLAAIVVCALLPMFKQFKDPYDYWNISRYDTVTWVITWFSVVFLDVTLGLGIGIAFSIFTISFQSFQSNGYALMNMQQTEVYVPKSEKESKSIDRTGIAVFRFESGLHFATKDRFKQQLIQATVNPKQLAKAAESQNGKVEENGNNPKDTDSPQTQVTNGASNRNKAPNQNTSVHIPDLNSNLQPHLHTIIIDCSCISYVDMAGLHTLKMVCLEYKKAGIEIALANCSMAIQQTLMKAAMTDSCPTYPTIHDAVLATYSNSLEAVSSSHL